MRRILLALMSTLAVVVVLFSYRTSTADPASGAATTVATGPADTSGTGTTTPAAPVPTATPTASTDTDADSGSDTNSASTPTAPTTASTTPATADSTAAKTYTGDAADTRWGPVQVEITVADGKVTAVDLLQVPSENGRDVEINDQAVPVLKEETLSAQSAQIDAVSGATVTSDGYTTSLQSALDQAGL